MNIRFSLALALALTAIPLLGESLGPLTVSGNVWTNQIAIPSGSSVYAGDQVRTDVNGVAVIGSGRSRVEVRPKSLVTLHAGGIDLHEGAVGSSGSTVDLKQARVSSADDTPDSWFVVSKVEGQTLVAAYRGDAQILASNGNRTIVPVGSFALATTTPRSADGSSSKTDGKAPNNQETAPAGTTGKNGWSIGSLASTKGILIATGAAAAALTGFAVTGNDDLRDQAVSPR